MKWSLEHAYDEYPRIEEAFSADLDASLEPHGPAQLFDLVAEMSLPAGSVAVDAGCGEGGSAVALAERFGFAVTGVDPVRRHLEVARALGSPVDFRLGTAEALPFADGTVDLVWCRDVLVHVADLDAVYAEFRRVLAPTGRILVYQMFGTDLLEPGEAGWLFETMGVVPASADPATTEAAIGRAGLEVRCDLELGSQWGEFAQERDGKPGRKLLHVARMRREPGRFLAKYGRRSYDMMLGDGLWHVYAMIGKLTRRVLILEPRPTFEP